MLGALNAEVVTGNPALKFHKNAHEATLTRRQVVAFSCAQLIGTPQNKPCGLPRPLVTLPGVPLD